MRVIVKSEKVNLWIPVPISLAGVAISLIPRRAYMEMQQNVPAEYREFLTKETFQMIYWACKDLLKECRGLEVVRVEAADGTFVSIKI